jgi:hypothetical protein
MNKTIIFLFSFILFFFILVIGFAADSEKLLTVNDVEKVTEIQGIKLVPRNPAMGAGGDLNFAKEDNTMLLTVAIQDSSMYKRWKSEEGFFHADVSGIGDEAFEGPGVGEHRYILIFRKGKKAFSLSSFFDMSAGGKTFLSQDQLRALAKIILSRL